MKRLLNSFKMLTLTVIVISAMSLPTVASAAGCNGFLHGDDQYGTHWDCFFDYTDGEYCYYTCYGH